MTVNDRTISPHTTSPDVPLLERSAAAIVAILHTVASASPAPVLWPAPGVPDDSERMLAWSRDLAGHFSAMRRRARISGQGAMLQMFEEDLRPLEATTRAAVTGRLSQFASISDRMREVEVFAARWVPYIDPLPEPAPRIRCDERDRSVWIDGRCLATGLDRNVFSYARALAAAYPNTLAWRVVRNTLPGFKGKNQTRFKSGLPDELRKVIETTATGSVFRLSPILSTTVQAA